MNELTIDGRRIASDAAPYCIAEISANHNGDIQNALTLISEAKRAGAHAVKLQTYRPDTITLKSDAEEFQIRSGLWAGKSLYDLYEEAHTPWEWHEALFEHARDTGITIFSSPFDKTAVDLLERLGAPAYKIASFEAIDLPLIEYVAATGKPLIISTGMANEDEIAKALAAARKGGAKDVALLQCVSAYPAQASEYNLRTLVDMAERFDVLTGLSDHTIDNTTAIASVVLGATIIEKHFTLDRSGGGPDDSFSLEPQEFAHLVDATRDAHLAMGTVDYGLRSSEIGNAQFRRSLYFVNALRAGDTIGEADVASVRPGFGIAPEYLPKLIGATMARDVEKHTRVAFEDVEGLTP